MLPPGFTQFLQFVILTLLPLSICFCLVVMLVVEKEEWRDFFGLSVPSFQAQLARNSRDSHTALLCATFRAMLALSACGLCFVILNVAAVDIYKEHGGCVDPLIKTSCVTSLAQPHWQWSWVMLSCCASIAVDFLLEMMRRSDKTTHAKAVFNTVQMMLEMRSEQKAAIANWQAQMPVAMLNKADGDKQPTRVGDQPQTRNYFYCVVLLLLLVLASLPSLLYILAKVGAASRKLVILN